MARMVVSLLKESLRGSYIEGVQINSADVAKYMRERYMVGKENVEEVINPKEKQKDLKVQPEKPSLYNRLLNSNHPNRPNELRTKPKTLLQRIAIERANQRRLNDNIVVFSPPDVGKLYKENRKQKARTPRKSLSTSDVSRLKNSIGNNKSSKKIALNRLEVRKPEKEQGDYPKQWPIYRALPSMVKSKFEQIKELSEKRAVQTGEPSKSGSVVMANKLISNASMSTIGEAKLRAVRERKERKEQLLAVARIEARKARVAELRARADAIYSAKFKNIKYE